MLTPSFDKPEQVFELLVQTVKNELHVELDENFDLILNVGAHELYDEVSESGFLFSISGSCLIFTRFFFEIYLLFTTLATTVSFLQPRKWVQFFYSKF